MKSFKEFISEEWQTDKNAENYRKHGAHSLADYHDKIKHYTPEKHIEKILKTQCSIKTHVMSGGLPHHSRGSELVSRHDSHIAIMKERHPKHYNEFAKHNHTDGNEMYAYTY